MNRISSGQDMSAMKTPILSGYTVTWDHDAKQWFARSNTTDTVLYGKDQRELELARNRVVVQLADDLTQIIQEAPARGYSPPPRR